MTNSEQEVASTFHPENPAEDYYRLMIEGITDYAIFLLDATGHVATWNAGAQLIKQYKASEIIGKHFSVFYTAEAKNSDYPSYELKEAKAHGRFEDEGWRVRKDGTLFWANVIITAVYNKEAKLIGFSKVTRDLSERKRAEEELLEAYEELDQSEGRYRILVEGVTDYAIFMLDPTGHVATWNEGARRIKGYEANEIIGQYFSKFYSQESIQKGFPEYELKMARAEGRFEDEGWRYKKDGSAFWANVVITAMYNTHQELIGFSKITRDLTERRRNEELMLKNKELVRINNDLDNFVYTASHDLKAPVVNLEGLLTALEEDMGPDKEKYRKLLSMMGGSVTTLKKVIEDLGDVTQLQQEKGPSGDVKILELLKEVSDSLGERIAKSGAEIKVEALEFESLRYSRKNFRSILYNLVSNAIKYADPRRAPVVTLKTYITDTGDHVLSITDNGLGIPKTQFRKMFTMYKRLHDHVEGSGIGLYIVKKILENSGDSIMVESEVGKGTEFMVHFKHQAS